LNIEIKQLRLWLKRGLDMGRIKKLKKPVRYVIVELDYDTQPETQKSLFG